MTCQCCAIEAKQLSDKVPTRRLILSKRAALEAKVAKIMETIYGRLWIRIANQKMKAAAIEARYDPTADFEQELMEAIQEYTAAGFLLGNEEARRILVREGLARAYNAPALAVLEQEGAKFMSRMSAQMSETAKRTIMDVINQGLNEGWTIRRMQEVMKEKAEVALGRSETIARTIVNKSYNIGTMSSFESSDLKTAVLVGCDPTCDECGPHLGVSYPVAEAMAIEESLHPNHVGSWVPDEAEIDMVISQVFD